VIFHELNSLAHFQEKPINWAGFYITDPTNEQRLILGPFQGKVCSKKLLEEKKKTQLF
jgi:L-methionine (R)-S-oxide reductase